jgi:hypothetical protein
MPKSSAVPNPCEEFDHVESDVLDLLAEPTGWRLWSPEEVGREVGGQSKAIDALNALHRAGLIHRTADGFVFATRAAIRALELAG